MTHSRGSSGGVVGALKGVTVEVGLSIVVVGKAIEQVVRVPIVELMLGDQRVMGKLMVGCWDSGQRRSQN